MPVSFVIPLHNCLALTRECLRTLRATLPADLPHEIIFVDDGSTDGTRAWLAGLGNPDPIPPQLSAAGPCRILLNEHNLGFARACNRGAVAARGDIIFFLNNDLVLAPGWFEPMRAAFDRFPDAGLVGNVQLVAATGAIDHAGMYFNHQAKPVHDATIPRRDRRTGFRPVPALTGACFAIRRADWQKLGGFDEGYVNGGEDIDLCLRARAAGRRNFVALRSVVRHHVSQSPGRKQRDEENSRRLMTRWRQTLVPLSVPAWCRHYLKTEWQRAHDPQDFPRAAQALVHVLGWSPQPGNFATEGVQRAIELELTRWRELLDGAPPAATENTDPI